MVVAVWLMINKPLVLRTVGKAAEKNKKRSLDPMLDYIRVDAHILGVTVPELSLNTVLGHTGKGGTYTPIISAPGM